MKRSFVKQLAGFLAIGLFAALVAVVVVKRTTDEPSAPFLANTRVEASTDEVVTVSRADIRSQFTVPGTIVDNPSFVLLAGHDGVLAHAITDGLAEADSTIGEVGGQSLNAPRQLEVVEWLVPDGATVTADLPVVEVRLVGFAVRVMIEGADGYRLLAGTDLTGRASIDGGPGPFDCPIVQPTQADEDDPSVGGPASVGVLCLLPIDVRAVAEVPATLLITNKVVEGALVLPVTAVRGLIDDGEVSIVADGTVGRRAVKLGITDGVIIEITDGLNEGDQVSASAPPLAGP